MSKKIEDAADHIREGLQILGFTFPEGTLATPERIAKYWDWLINKTEQIKWTTFDAQETDEIILVKSIQYVSACEHHFLPFFGVAHVAYIPNDKIVGISKIPRLVKEAAKHPQTQEYLTNTIAKELEERLQPQGVAVVLQGEHTCMSCRGVLAHGSMTQTSKVTGVFSKDASAKKEFFSLIK